MRLLITASRTWDHRMSVEYIIRHALQQAQAAGRPLTVVHGDADGGDRLAKMVAIQLKVAGYPVDHEPHPADWSAPCTLTCQPGHRQYRRGGGDYCVCGWDNAGETKAGLTHDDHVIGVWRLELSMLARRIGAGSEPSRD